MAQIFSYLTPSMLLEASRASRAWREGILDSRLWKYKFRTEGWSLHTEEIERFEKSYYASIAKPRVSRPASIKQKGSMRPDGRRSGHTNSPRHYQEAQRPSKIPAPAPSFLPCDALPVKNEIEEEKTLQDFDEFQGTLIQPGEDEIRQTRYPSDDQEMQDAGTVSPVSTAQDRPESFQDRKVSEFFRARETQLHNEKSAQLQGTPSRSAHSADRASTTERPLMLFAASGQPRLNYHHVFKQKRKLEDNWTNGQYRSFQLPHRDHPEDAHTECVYTIQYSGKYLVSGSRDRTLRIWDLDTERLVTKPLQGHTGSVLCLQFDHSEEEDIIISGSSDTHVILWRFSTGEMIKQLTNAHRESVLNLKFDKRFLVTCSKDKTIKIWNRHELQPGDRDYPVKGVSGGGQCPTYILDMHTIGSALREERFKFSEMLLEPYTHMMTLDLHGAAVNAIQIYKDELVSASGDRNLRVWNIHTGECSTKIEAHTKGIACVQYDGKRIVSGSSDNSIRIWDPISRTEVARLDGHSRLVRTIQAAFADPPGGRERLEAEADEVKRQWQAASMAGLIPPPLSAGRQPRSAPGSRKPRDIRSVGAKIPPSGGGSRWGRIVSGSYDETIIIWKKTDDDEWVIGHRLRQEEALRAAGPPLIPRSDIQAQYEAQSRAQHEADARANTEANNHSPTVNDQLDGGQQWHTAPQPRPQPPPESATSSTYAQATTQGARTPAQASPFAGPRPSLQRPSINPGIVRGTMAAHPSVFYSPEVVAQRQAQRQAQQQAQQPQHPQHLPHQTASMSQSPSQTRSQPQPQHAPPPPPAQPAQPRPVAPAVAPIGQPNARVFKLQFDARRIICCSQDPKIVGWDFANGDEQIIECSRFFAAPQ